MHPEGRKFESHSSHHIGTLDKSSYLLAALRHVNSDTVSMLVAVACRGSWMPGANEVFGCPGQDKFQNLSCLNFSKKFIRLPKFLSHLPKDFPPKNFLNSSPKIFDDFFKVIYYYLFFYKTGLLDAPRLDARGHHTICTPSASHWLVGSASE